MNNRQIELQVIIRNLQNKILIQKQQNKILSQRYDQRIKQIEEDNSRKIHEKQRMVEYLTLQLDKDRQMILNEQKLYDTKREKQKDEVYKQYERYKYKSLQLQQKLQTMIQKYQLEKKGLENQIKKYQQKQFDQSFSKASISGEIQKLNKFYHQSRIDQPKRKQLIEWTQKLSNLISKTQSRNTKTLQELFSYLKSNLQAFKTQLTASLTHASQSEEQVLKIKKQILHEIKQIIKQQSKTTNEIVETNQKLFETLKKQKSSMQLQKINELQRQLMESKKKSNDTIQQLCGRIKILQGERKTLLLGFNQLKSLNESRQKIYKQEISQLKQVINKLLVNGQQRQYQFQKQTKLLHDQLLSISQRYYQNIEIPLNRMTNKLDSEIKVARLELQKLSQNRVFIKTIQNLEEIMQNYILENTNSTKFISHIKDYINKAGDIVYWAQQVFQQENDRQLLQREEEIARQQVSAQSFQYKVNHIETNIKEIEWKEKQNKLLYQLATAKKLNKKLKQYCDSLEIKSKEDNRSVTPTKKSRLTSSNNKNNHTSSNIKISSDQTQKVLELQAHIQKLTLENKSYSQQYLYQLKLLKDYIGSLTGKEIKQEKNLLQMQRQIKQIVQFNAKLQKYLEKDNNHMLSIRQTLSTINRMLLKPVEIFDSFVEKITNCYQTPTMSPTKANKEAREIPSATLFVNLQQAYKDIYNKKQDNYTQTNKLFLQFIKLLRDSTPNHPKMQKTLPHQPEKPLERSRVVARDAAVEKKIKDLQNLRLKSREQTIRRLQKIQQSLKVIDNKYSKRHFTNLTRIEQSIARKIDELRQKCIQKLKQGNSEITEITGTVLKDIRNKLKLCMNQNEGLTKQIQLLQKLKKKQ